jgi:hypothetical protein
MIMYDMILSGPFLRAGDTSQAVRLMSVALRLTVNGTIDLSSRHDLRGIQLSSRDPVELNLDPVNMNDVSTFAKQVLDLPVDAGAPDLSPTYVVHLQPAEDKAWGEVSSKSEISVTISARRDG